MQNINFNRFEFSMYINTVQTLYPQNILVPNDTPLFDKQSKATIPQKQQSYHVVTNPPKGTHPQKQQPYQRQTLKGKVRDPNKHYCSCVALYSISDKPKKATNSQKLQYYQWQTPKHTLKSINHISSKLSKVGGPNKSSKYK